MQAVKCHAHRRPAGDYLHQKTLRGFAGAVGLRAMTTPHGLGYVKMVIMVDEDVDPFNLPQVMWALSSKVNPAGDLVQLPNMSVLELDPGSSPAGITDKLIIDATTPVAPDNRVTTASRWWICRKPKPGLKN
ncbi:hypothetical protein ACLB1R_19495 [Escherichia coli]